MTAERDAYEVLQVHPRAEQQVIQAAYRVLAAMYHPDRSTSSADARRMVELNAAYNRSAPSSCARPTIASCAWAGVASDRLARMSWQRPRQAVLPDAHGRPLDFGRYEGLTVAQIARRDMDYLRWLRRHASGARIPRRDRRGDQGPRPGQTEGVGP